MVALEHEIPQQYCVFVPLIVLCHWHKYWRFKGWSCRWLSCCPKTFGQCLTWPTPDIILDQIKTLECTIFIYAGIFFCRNVRYSFLHFSSTSLQYAIRTVQHAFPEWSHDLAVSCSRTWLWMPQTTHEAGLTVWCSLQGTWQQHIYSKDWNCTGISCRVPVSELSDIQPNP